jgi:hypothetical protein
MIPKDTSTLICGYPDVVLTYITQETSWFFDELEKLNINEIITNPTSNKPIDEGGEVGTYLKRVFNDISVVVFIHRCYRLLT